MLGKGDLFGNSFIGVYCAANEHVVLVPITATEELIARARKNLEVENVLKTSMDGASVIGSLVCMNSKGAIMSYFVNDFEMENIGAHINAARLPHKLNAAGNNILANDNGALAHPGFEEKTLNVISETLGVPVEAGTVAGYKTVGSAATATNKGVICHPHASSFEMEQLERVLGVEVSIATANYGSGLVGACMIANSKGALVGEDSTPIELGKIEDGLKLY